MLIAEHLAHDVVDLVNAASEISPALAYVAIASAMLLENLFPPLPSELIMPLGGFLVQQGKLELLPVLVAGLLGSVIGASFWYGVGRWIDEDRLQGWLLNRGRWLGIPPSLLPRSRRWFDRHGVLVVFWGRLIPGLRPFVSLPAGFELMPAFTFLLWTTAGTGLWVLALTLAGLALGSAFAQVNTLLARISSGLLPLLLLVPLGWSMAWLWQRRR
ncbi:MAG: DedA family protein [Synechococcaceae cyanobacterium]